MLKKNPPKLILASCSPRRQEYLKSLGVDFDIITADIDETPLKREKPLAYTRRIARAKAAKIASLHPECVVLAADTPVYVGRTIMQNPETPEEERQMLQAQSGKKVHIPTVVILHLPDGTVKEKIVQSWSKLKKITEEDIQFFLKDETLWRGISGGMQYLHPKTQTLVKEMRGSFTGIRGLPLYETAELLKEVGYDV